MCSHKPWIAWDILLVILSMTGNLCNKCPKWLFEWKSSYSDYFNAISGLYWTAEPQEALWHTTILLDYQNFRLLYFAFACLIASVLSNQSNGIKGVYWLCLVDRGVRHVSRYAIEARGSNSRSCTCFCHCFYACANDVTSGWTHNIQWKLSINIGTRHLLVKHLVNYLVKICRYQLT